MRAYRAQAEQARGPESGHRAKAPATFAQRVRALQRSAGNAVVARAVEEERHEHGAGCGHETAEPPAAGASVQQSSVVDAVRSPGRPLDSRVMEKAEQGYGMSFRHVRVHSDPVAQRSAAALGARAYTTGHDIVVGPQGADDETMFHELDHVRQQSLGPVAGTDNGSGVAVSHQDDPFERHASANGRRMAQGSMPDLTGPGSGASTGTPAEAHEGGGITVARMMAGRSRKMHKRDRGQMFEISGSRGPIVGRYVRSSSEGTEIFDTTQGRIEVYPEQILGPRATVGGLHPEGRTRPPEENLHDRDQIFLSEADLSAARARVRRDPGSASRMAATTFEERPDYEGYEDNREDLRRLGVPVLNNVDLSRPEAAGRLSNVGPNANLHFQMPRVPRGTPGYSTRELVRDTGRLPGRAGRDDVTVSVTTPHPSQYPRPGTHNGFYGMENRKGVPEGMRIAGEHSDDDADLEDYGYGHRQSTRDVGAAVADRRKTYRMESDRRSNSPDEDAEPDYRSRSMSRSRASQAPPAPSRRRRPSRPPMSTIGRPQVAVPVNYAAVEDEDEYFGSQQPESSSHRRRRSSRAPSFVMESEDERPRPRRRSRHPVSSGSFAPEPERERSRSRHRPSRHPADTRSFAPEPERERSRSRSRSRHRPSRAPAGMSSSRPIDLGDDFSYGSGPIDAGPSRERGRSRPPASSRAPFITDSGRSTFVPASYAEPEWDEDFPGDVNPFLPRERGRRR
ncbi:DUF4157 domain-containing protein [Streptomyces sp. NBC_00059]|uniref:eCIS core domain-containing protein n=1 Tax=Streptomyces sp. NBC_00059 TaxID=2975635 RepID=UPI00225C3F8E|nr:DUF4157 domain-containing protein [Streptomyces sp. NBC_00059]MCX5416824.1 DUF4157 domain-containing protein [Streptomyces sp. NBC_00059]